MYDFLINRINELEKLIVKTLADLQKSVATLTTVQASTVKLLTDLAAMIRSLPTGDAQAISDLADAVDANVAALSAAVTANTDLDTTTTAAP